jgi:hypothetical protein
MIDFHEFPQIEIRRVTKVVDPSWQFASKSANERLETVRYRRHSSLIDGGKCFEGCELFGC